MSELAPDYLLKEQYEALGHDGLGFTEIRLVKTGKQIFVSGMEEYVKTALSYIKQDVYVGVNPRKTQSGKTEDISHITAIVFDFDPVRPKDAPSSDEQHQEAIKLAGEFARSVDGLLVSSGSGAHVYIPIVPIAVSDHALATGALRDYAKTVQSKYTTKTVRVDSTFDLPRVIRCWGSFNSKSKRPCDFLSGQYNRQRFDISKYYPVVPPERSAVLFVPKNDLEKKFQKAVERNSKIRDIINGTARYASRSESDFALASYLFRAGFSIGEAKLLLLKNPKGKAKERSERDLDAEIRRIWDKVSPTIPAETKGLDVNEYIKDLESRSPGISTGFRRWDRMTAGLKGGRFYILAARPTSGKTTQLAQVALNIASQGHKVLFFPTEVSRASLVDKMVSLRSGVGLEAFQFGSFREEEKIRVLEQAKYINSLPLVIVEDFSLTIKKVQDTVESVNPDVVILDFLQCMRYSDVNNSSELGANVVAVKQICKERNIPVILASQLHRKPSVVPISLSDLKGTGKLEEEGDVVTFVNTINSDVYPVESEFAILKNKYGEPGTIKMKFYRATCRFEEAE